MSLILSNQGVKPIGENYTSEKIYTLSPSQYEEITMSCVPPHISNPAGQNCSISITHIPTELYRVNGLYLQWLATNSSGTEAPTWLNPYNTLSSIKCIINKKEVHHIANRKMLEFQINDYLKNYGPHDIFTRLQKFRTEVGTTLNGETVPVSGSQRFSLDLYVLFPFLEEYICNDIIKFLEFEFVFAPNNASLANALFVKSNTTNNAYGSNLTYSAIQLKMNRTYHTDARLYKHINPIRLVVPKFETKTWYAQSWTGTESITFDLQNTFANRARILGIVVDVESQALITAYNDSDSSLHYSSPADIGFKISSKSKVIVDLRGAAKAHERRSYLIDVNKNRYGHYPHNDVISNVGNLGKIYISQTYIDFSNISIQQDTDYGIAGINNFIKDIEVELTSESNINASCNVTVGLHYIEVVNIVNANKDIEMLSR